MRPACGGFPHFIIAPWARCGGPSLAHRSSRGIHAAQPTAQRFRSAF
ncbi:nucleoid-structuring protein H-NS [Pseudomonas cavernicola]|uniref:Nucleoid-structuring protein H-NS n=1 Tax=Pseudomonas cavernicola TaxID=2320866 RepID=A0A418XPG7_9PSED|nr:nucleoid-structuring protein H-NS [Pseudomonas cavernicola]